MQEISAGLIIYKKDPGPGGLKFLLLYHGRNYWNFPKGKLEPTEKSFVAALREVKEETGLGRNDLKFNQYFKTNEKFSFWRGKEKVFKVVTFYLAESRKKEIKISDEHEGFGWFSASEAARILKHEGSRRVLKQAGDFLKKRPSSR